MSFDSSIIQYFREKNNDFPAGKQFFHVFLLVDCVSFDSFIIQYFREKNNDFPAGKQFFHVFLLVSSSCHARMNIFS